MRNKDEELRREGMAYALRIAKENGIDSLEEECRFRGATKLPLALPKNAIDECVSKIKLNTIDTVTILSAMVLHDEFDFGISIHAPLTGSDCRKWASHIQSRRRSQQVNAVYSADITAALMIISSSQKKRR